MQETPQEYRERVISYTKDLDPLKLLAKTTRKLDSLLRGAPSTRLRKRPTAGKWSVAEIVAHLADSEIVGGYRIRLILGAPGTPIPAFDQDNWAMALHYEKRDTRKLLNQFRADREENLALLKMLSPEQWKQYGIHSERGEESIETIVRMYAGHDLNHIRQIEEILRPKRH